MSILRSLPLVFLREGIQTSDTDSKAGTGLLATGKYTWKIFKQLTHTRLNALLGYKLRIFRLAQTFLQPPVFSSPAGLFLPNAWAHLCQQGVVVCLGCQVLQPCTCSFYHFFPSPYSVPSGRSYTGYYLSLSVHASHECVIALDHIRNLKIMAKPLVIS